MKTDLTAPHFTNEEAARAHYEAIRWPDGPICAHCGSINNATKMAGKTTRPGLYKCKEPECRKPFTATMGSIFEKSHIPLHKWLLATHILCASKKGVSAHQLWRMLGFGSYKTAWFMAHRIREAMKGTSGGLFGSGFGGVEADETLQGFDPAKSDYPHNAGGWQMNRVLTLVDRDSGAARSFVLSEFNVPEVRRILNENVAKEAYLLTDEAGVYRPLGEGFTFHGTVNHGEGEYVSREAPWVHINSVEGYYSIFKRGMRGVYQHCSTRHLHRYAAEFDFRYSNRAKLGVDDNMRTEKALKGTVGRRLTYHPPKQPAHA